MIHYIGDTLMLSLSLADVQQHFQSFDEFENIFFIVYTNSKEEIKFAMNPHEDYDTLLRSDDGKYLIAIFDIEKSSQLPVGDLRAQLRVWVKNLEMGIVEQKSIILNLDVRMEMPRVL